MTPLSRSSLRLVASLALSLAASGALHACAATMRRRA
jgi:hypothetical protein